MGVVDKPAKTAIAGVDQDNRVKIKTQKNRKKQMSRNSSSVR
jgi:hypothetical protein